MPRSLFFLLPLLAVALTACSKTEPPPPEGIPDIPPGRSAAVSTGDSQAGHQTTSPVPSPPKSHRPSR